MNSYELSRAFCNWAFENPEKIKPIHYAIYFFTIEHCNRLGWKEKFGLPSQMVMEAIGVKNWRTYSEGLNELISFGFLTMVETSKNQYSSNIVAIVNFTKAHTEADTKALDKALSKHSTKQGQGTVSIDKQLNKEQLNKEQIDIPSYFDFLNHALEKIPDIDQEALKLKYDAWVENGWKDGYNKKITNWKSKLTNTLRYLPKLEPQKKQSTPSRRTTNEIFDKVKQDILNGQLEIKPII